ncbi:LytTR family DNA-binding domain-containing protein [Streptococcus thoraltensis]|uniref:LytTR family DNA-binding domain-containing protein n=1 Tax=Streptococcus thoraltensis TaxID=55085 RepID=UPI000381056C|nr:LytTR family DNA-binding domain-containing protein [Streptococcus thoraltensis]MDY4760871.1 LytTR family DNA-binding domain-containing protein [Streptococcus thoraltensis]
MKWFFEKSSVDELSIIIKNREYTSEVVDLIAYLESYASSPKGIVSVKTLDDILILKIDDIVAAEVDGDYLNIYYHNREISTRQRLCQFKQRLNHPDMIQVSKQSLINIQHLERMEASFSGNMTAFLTNGLKITVSRRYLKTLEKRLGL